MNAKGIIGGLIIVAALAWGASAFFTSTVAYVSIEEAAKAKRTVQVMGKVDQPSVHYASTENRLEFSVTDPEATDLSTAPRMPVIYYGTVPGNLDQAVSVVLKGKPNTEGQFVADQILVKCPSKYQGEGNEGEYQDIQKDIRDGGSGTS